LELDIMSMRKTLPLTLAAIAAGTAGLLWNGQVPTDGRIALVSTAEAVRGRPLTPVSYAGVARRTTRRAVTYGAAVAAPVVIAPGRTCVQVVNAYGQITYRCP
jgi:hypothetical protein